MNWLLLFRRICQILIIALFLGLPWLNNLGYNGARGSLFAFDIWGIPFADPASAAQAALAGGFSLQPHILEYFLGAVLALIVAFLAGRIFCGWLCPYGFFSELVHAIRIRKNTPLAPKTLKSVWIAKCGWLILCLLAGFIFAWPVITFLSMPGQLSLLGLPLWLQAGVGVFLALLCIPLAALVCEFISGRRLWCEYLCPQSVFLGAAAALLPKKFPGIRITWQPAKCVCGRESPCAAVCGLNLNPRHKNGPARKDCSMCGNCVEACKKRGGALGFSLKANSRQNQEKTPNSALRASQSPH